MKTTFEFENDTVQFNKYDKPVYHQCQHETRTPPLYGSYWNTETTRCGGDSMYLLTYSVGSGKKITKHLCSRHAQEFLEYNKISLEKKLSYWQGSSWNQPEPKDICEALDKIDKALEYMKLASKLEA